MKNKSQHENGSAVLCAVLTLAIVSLIAAGVLYNCTTRYNVSAKQVKAWNEALYAAEAGADVAFAEVRKIISSGCQQPGNSCFTTTFSGDGWSVAAQPTPGPAYSKSSITLGQNNSLSAKVTVDSLPTMDNGIACLRIRSIGTATLSGVRRMGMDDKLLGTADTATHFANGSATRGSGDSLLRKIDFNYDHFRATYGDGDGNNASLQTVSSPQLTRRIETIVVPAWAFTGALKATGTFDGPGSAGVIDSYDSKNGAYYFAANNPSDPHYSDATNGDVSVGTSSFTQGGPIYGNLTTNGANATHSNTQVSGSIDNNVPFTIPPLVEPDTTSYTSGGNGNSLTVPAGTTAANPATYVFNATLSSGNSAFTINGQNVAAGLPNAGQPAEVYVTIVVNGDVGNVKIAQGVNAKIYFTGNLSIKLNKYSNNNVDGAAGTYNANGTPSTNYSQSGHLQFYGISPTDGSNHSINISPPGTLYATIYAPDDDVSIIGNVQIDGAVVCHNFSGNGNTGFHYDKEIAAEGGIPTDYRVASYIEDIR